jgi:tyrosinase
MLAASVISQCTNPSIRKEWRSLSPEEQQKFLTTLQALHDKPEGDANDVNSWNFDQFAQTHWDYQAPNHNKPPFFPWHRVYLDAFEKALQTIDSTVTLPYWDWTIDSQRPELSPIFADDAFGGDGDPITRCLNTGVSKGWIGAAPRGNSCLKRCTEFGTLYPPEAVSAIISTAEEFKLFADRIENGPHGLVHWQVGGECGDISTMAAANDPLFFLHHAMVDRIWLRWQTKCEGYEDKFEGNLDRRLEPYDFTIAESFSISSSKLCYSYDPSPADVPINATCATTEVTTTAVEAVATVVEETTTTSSPVPLPTNVVDDFWLEHMLQALVPGASPISANLLAAGLVGTKMANFNFEESARVGQNESFVPTNYHPREDFSVVAPANEDTTDLIHLRFPSTLNDMFIQRMNLDRKKVEDAENFSKMIIDEVNNQPDYISPAALTFIYQSKYYRQLFTNAAKRRKLK